MSESTRAIVGVIAQMFEEDQKPAEGFYRPAKRLEVAKIVTAGLTPDETAKLVSAVTIYHFDMTRMSQNEDLLHSVDFAHAVYRKAMDELKPKYKDDFNVHAIAAALRNLVASYSD